MSVLNSIGDNWRKLFKRVEEEELVEKGTSVERLEDDKRIADVIASLERSEAFGFFLGEVRKLQAQKKDAYSRCKENELSVLQAEDRTYQTVLELVPKAKQRSAEIKAKITAMMREDGIM